jgi:Na+/H+-dicarboxylate symporter
MGRTALNVHAGQLTAAVVDKWEGKLDVEKYTA